MTQDPEPRHCEEQGAEAAVAALPDEGTAVTFPQRASDGYRQHSHSPVETGESRGASEAPDVILARPAHTSSSLASAESGDSERKVTPREATRHRFNSAFASNFFTLTAIGLLVWITPFVYVLLRATSSPSDADQALTATDLAAPWLSLHVDRGDAVAFVITDVVVIATLMVAVATSNWRPRETVQDEAFAESWTFVLTAVTRLCAAAAVTVSAALTSQAWVSGLIMGFLAMASLTVVCATAARPRGALLAERQQRLTSRIDAVEKAAQGLDAQLNAARGSSSSRLSSMRSMLRSGWAHVWQRRNSSGYVSHLAPTLNVLHGLHILAVVLWDRAGLLLIGAASGGIAGKVWLMVFSQDDGGMPSGTAAEVGAAAVLGAVVSTSAWWMLGRELVPASTFPLGALRAAAVIAVVLMMLPVVLWSGRAAQVAWLTAVASPAVLVGLGPSRDGETGVGRNRKPGRLWRALKGPGEAVWAYHRRCESRYLSRLQEELNETNDALKELTTDDGVGAVGGSDV